MRRATISLALSIAFAGSAAAQSAAPIPQSRPAAAKPAAKAAVKPEGIAPVSKSLLPTFYGNTYQRIAAAMLSYTTIDLRGGWPTLPKTAQLAPGASGPNVVLLRKRLAMTDDLAADQVTSETYDKTLEDAVKRFQARHGLTETGSVGAKTLAALNVPVKQRLQQLAATMDRISELNFNFGQRYVVVNLPAAVAEAVDGDVVQKRYVIVVGKVGRKSPTLTTTINAVNLNPTWTVPLGIMKADVMPRMRRDPGYVSRMRMRVLDANGREVDPKSVDWNRSPNFSVRQDSGSGNALGVVRIDMSNKYSVYMHDTNHKEHFSRDYRFEFVGLRACRRSTRSRGVAAGRQSGLGPQGARRRDRHERSQDHQPDPQGAGGLGLFHRLGDEGRRRALPRRRVRPRRRPGENAGRVAHAGADRGALCRRLRAAVGGWPAAGPSGRPAGVASGQPVAARRNPATPPA